MAHLYNDFLLPNSRANRGDAADIQQRGRVSVLGGEEGGGREREKEREREREKDREEKMPAYNGMFCSYLDACV